MAKKFLIASMLLFLGWGAQAQDDVASTTYEGHDGSKVVVMTGLQDGMFTFLSEDQYLLSGNVTNDFGFVYDVRTNKTTMFNDYVLYAYLSPSRYVAAPKGESTLPYFVYNGQKIELQKTILNNETYTNDLTYWNAQPNGDRVVMLAYEWDYGYNSLNQYDSATNPVGVIYDGKTGKVITKLHSYWPRKKPLRNEENINYGSRANAISADGKVVGGWGTWPTDSVISTWQTTFWDISDLNNIQTYAIADTRFSMSDLTGANRDGSLLVGYNEETGHGLIIHYNRASKSFTLDTISPLPGYGLLFLNTVDDNGMIFGFCGVAADPGTRKAVVYDTKNKILIDLNTYLYEYYDITIPTELGCPTLTALDGSIVAGFYFLNGFKMPWYIQFGTERILPRARNVKAKAIGTGFTARVTWQEPLISEHTLTGYEIYRDASSTPIATLGKNELSYDDEDCEEGYHIYKVVAIYTNDKAGAATSNTIMTGSIFPVQQIGHQLQYNRYAAVYWGMPSSEVITIPETKVAPKAGKGIIDRSPTVSMSRTAPANAAQAKQYTNASLDYIDNVDMLMYNGYCGIKIGDLYYVSSWQGDGLRILDEYNTVKQDWKPAGLNESVLSMVYFPDKQQLYCGTLNSIYILDLTKPDRIIDMYSIPSRHLTYLPDLEIKGNKGVLMAGGWDAAAFFTLDGKYLEESGFDFTDLSVTGTAYHNGKVYAASQSGKYSNEIYVFDLATRQQIGDPIQVVEDPAVLDILNPGGDDVDLSQLSVSGGLTTCMLEDSTMALVAGYQCSYVRSQLMFLELESAPERNGYNLYRNGVLIARNLTSRRYYDELTPGSYKYEVKAIYTNEESAFSPATTIKIENYDNCLPVKDLKAHETNRWVVLDWDVPTNNTGLIGFTVFRNGTKLAELWNDEVSLNYNDISDLKKGSAYTYRIETLYSSGCKATDSVKITITDEGTAMAPYGISLRKKKSASSSSDNKLFDVTAEWETPMFEEAMSIGYGGGVLIAYNSFGEDLPKAYWAAIGWDSTDLKLYKDLYLVGMEYMLGDNTTSFEAFVYLNDEKVYTESVGRAVPKNWQTLYFKHSFKMNQPNEVAVGYHITYRADASPVALDYSANKPRYSDLLSFDGQKFSSLSAYEINASWAIRALVARKRDLAAATRPDGTLNPDLLEGKIIRLNDLGTPVALKQTPVKTMNIPSPKAPLTLKGFNIYRQRMDREEAEVKLNSDLLKTFSFSEAQPLPAGEYDYTVEAVYANTTVKATEPITLEDESTEEELNGMRLILYPNPTSDIVYVNGEYAHLQILDLGGRVLRQLPAISQISLNGMMPGTYFFRFTDESGRMATYKVVIQ